MLVSLRDVVVAARERLRRNPGLCKLELLSHGETATRSPKGGRLPGEQHEHGSVCCVAAYLGEENWSRAKRVNVVAAGER